MCLYKFSKLCYVLVTLKIPMAKKRISIIDVNVSSEDAAIIKERAALLGDASKGKEINKDFNPEDIEEKIDEKLIALTKKEVNIRKVPENLGEKVVPQDKGEEYIDSDEFIQKVKDSSTAFKKRTEEALSIEGDES